MPATPRASPVFSTHTAIRAVGPPEAPFEGLLARAPNGDTVLLVDRERLRGWPAWCAPSGGHVLAPLDVLRRTDGHDVVLPALGDRIDRLLARRRAAGAALRDGEALTVAVSIVRGMACVHGEELAAEETSWWVSPEGKPLLVCGTGEDGLARASGRIIEAMAQDVADPALREVLGDVGRGLASAHVAAPEFDRWEEELFSTVPPEPLVMEVIGPGPRVAVPVAEEVPPAPGETRRGWWNPLASATDAAWADTVSDVLHRVRRAGRAAPGRRTRLLLPAVGAAGLVLIVGLGWPDSTGGAAISGSSATATSRPVASAPTPSARPAAGSGEQEDPVAALTALLAVRDECADAACRAAVNENTAEQLPGGAIDDPARSIRIIDDFGGLAVLRVEAGGRRPQLVTIVTTPAGWRVRDVFDAADPPA